MLVVVAALVVCVAALATLTLRRLSLPVAFAPALSIAALALLPAELGRALGSFAAGCGGALVVTLAALVVALTMWRPTASLSPSASVDRIALVLALVVATPIVDLAFGHALFDDAAHWAITATLVRHGLPIVFPAAPDFVLPYHFGFDALAGLVVVAGGSARLGTAFAMTASLAAWLSAAIAIGAQLAGKRGARLAAIALLIGSPLTWPLLTFLGPLSMESPYPAEWSALFQKPLLFVADFLQHPQGAAMPVALVTLWLIARVVFVERTHFALGVALLLSLAVLNTVYFLVVGLLCAVAAVLRARDGGWQRVPLRRAAIELAVLAATLALATMLQSMLRAPWAGETGVAAAHVVRGSFWREPLLLRAAHHVVFFLPALAGVVAGLRDRRTVHFAAVAALCFVVPNVVVLDSSWDIVKFYSLAQALGIGLCLVALARISSSEGNADSARTRSSPAIVVAVVVVLAAAPTAWLLARSLLNGVLQAPIPEARWRYDVAAARDDLWRHVPPHAWAFVDDPELALQSGILAPGFAREDAGNGGIPFDPVTLAKRATQWRAALTMQPDAMRALGVRYVIVGPPERSIVDAAARERLTQPPYSYVGDAGDWRVFLID